MHENDQTLHTKILGLKIRTPIIVASGTITDQEAGIRRLLALGAGAVVTKTIHPCPPPKLNERVLRIPQGMLNSTTYSFRSISEWYGILSRFARDKAPIIASIHASSPEALGELAEQLAPSGCPAMELGISCLNETSGRPMEPKVVESYVRSVSRLVAIPISAKLVVGDGIEERVSAAIDGGAHAITLSDTVWGLAMDPDNGEAKLGGPFGYSGPGIKPIVLAAIYGLRKKGFTIPILGSGGISCGIDAAEYLSLGCPAVQVYTALHSRKSKALVEITSELRDWLASREQSVERLVERGLDRTRFADQDSEAA